MPPPKQVLPNARHASRAPTHTAHHRSTIVAPDLPYDDLL
jgi:hypothetical protein